tara:strand:- start:1779 stop:3344 length:1566 start_codon:yes stop_codon:yes gene_type:complete
MDKIIKALADGLAQQGRGGDTMLAHITPEEAKILKALGGSGTINPTTGLPEFDTTWGDDDFGYNEDDAFAGGGGGGGGDGGIDNTVAVAAWKAEAEAARAAGKLGGVDDDAVAGMGAAHPGFAGQWGTVQGNNLNADLIANLFGTVPGGRPNPRWSKGAAQTVARSMGGRNSHMFDRTNQRNLNAITAAGVPTWGYGWRGADNLGGPSALTRGQYFGSGGPNDDDGGALGMYMRGNYGEAPAFIQFLSRAANAVPIFGPAMRFGKMAELGYKAGLPSDDPRTKAAVDRTYEEALEAERLDAQDEHMRNNMSLMDSFKALGDLGGNITRGAGIYFDEAGESLRNFFGLQDPIDEGTEIEGYNPDAPPAEPTYLDYMSDTAPADTLTQSDRDILSPEFYAPARESYDLINNYQERAPSAGKGREALATLAGDTSYQSNFASSDEVLRGDAGNDTPERDVPLASRIMSAITPSEANKVTMQNPWGFLSPLGDTVTGRERIEYTGDEAWKRDHPFYPQYKDELEK